MLHQKISRPLKEMPSALKARHVPEVTTRPYRSCDQKWPIGIRICAITGTSTALWAGILWAVFG